MKLALSQPNEIQHIRKFLNECGWLKDELRHMELEDEKALWNLETLNKKLRQKKRRK